MSSSKSISFLIALFLAIAGAFAPVLSASDGLAAVQSPPAQATASAVSVPVVLTGRDLLRQALDLLVADDFAQAEDLFVRSLDLTPDHSRDLQTWFSDYQEFLAQRRLRRQASSDRHIIKAQEKLADGQFQEALASAFLASKASPDPQALRSAPWLGELVQLCAAEAERLSAQGKYGEAALILREIALIFEDDHSWKQRFEQTGLHAGILGAYDKKSHWQQRLRDVNRHDFKRAVKIVDEHYVKPVDHRKMMLGLLNGFRTFLTTKRLDESFEGLRDRLAVISLLDFLGREVDELNKAPDVTAADLVRDYLRILGKGRDNLRLPEAVLVDLFASQAFQALDDYTEMIWPEQQEWFSRTTMGSFSGIGVQIRLNEAKQLEVVTPLVGTPAFRAGLQAADLIVAVDGGSTEGITINQAVRRITGKKGTKVVLTIRRPGRVAEFNVAIMRDVIRIKSVHGYSRLPDNGWNYIVDQRQRIAYVRISNFSKNTTGELDRAIKACRAQNARALILDLRFDPGGTLRAAEEVADRFLPRGVVIVSTRGRRAKPYVAKTVKPDSCAGWPVVVLTSDRSASAAEIVAGALQDHGRAVVVGERTFGKGLVQRPFRLRGFSDSEVSIKVTTAYWYLPKGRNVQRSDQADDWGVQPDFEVSLTPDEKKSLNNRWVDAIIIHPHDVESDDSGPGSDSSLVPADSQLAADSESLTEKLDEPTATPTADNSSATKPLNLPDPQLQTALLLARLELLVREN